MYNKIEIVSTIKGDITCTRVFADGKEIKNVHGIVTTRKPLEIPTVTFEVQAREVVQRTVSMDEFKAMGEN